MIHNFGGSARSRPRVNLGGRKREVTKEELLKKAAVDREQRDIQRKREHASRILQRQWARWKARRSAMNDLRGVYDWLVSKPDFDYRWALKLLFYFYNSREDVEKILELGRRVIQHKDDVLSKDDAIRLRRLLVRTALARNLADTQVAELITFVAFLNKVETESLVDVDLYFQMISRYLTRSYAEDARLDCLNTLLECILVPLASETDPVAPMRYQYFGEVVLANINLSRMPQVKDACLGLNIHWQSACLCFVGDNCIIQYLCNFIAITSESILTAQYGTKGEWMSKISFLLQRLWRYEVRDISKDAADHLEESQRISDFNKLPISLRDPEIRGIIESLYSPTLLRSLISKDLLIALSRFIMSLLMYHPGSGDALLLQLTLFATDPRSPFNLLAESFRNFKVSISSLEHSSLAMIDSQDSGIYFFMEVLSRTMLTMVDDEFFDSAKNPMSLEMIRATATSLKSLVGYSYADSFQPQVETQCFTREYVRNIYTKVLQQIQVRDSRQRFLPKDFFESVYFDSRIVNIAAAEAFPVETDQDDDGPQQPRSSCRDGRLLRAFPFFFPFLTRVEMLQTLIEKDAESVGLRNDFFHSAPRHLVVCRRGHEFDDGFDALWKLGSGIKGSLRVDYRDAHGMKEAGIDGGGLTKEFLTSVCTQAFHPDFGMFVETPERLLYPNPVSSARAPERLRHYEFLGRIIAKCIYEEILVDVAFAPFFLLNWVGKLAYIDDLKALDKDLYNGLLQLKNYTGDVENDFALDFTTSEEMNGSQRTIELIASGADVPVTKANRLHYIQLMCNFKLNTRIARQSQAFVRGLSDVLDLRWLSLFSQNEMQAVVGGAPVPINISDLEKNTVYGGFKEDDATVKIFWEVLAEFDDEERRKLLKFVTSTPRPPLLGFGDLQPKFSVRNAGNDLERLPTASTCVNLLKLPAYQSHEQMRHKLRLSITAEAGFDLS